MNRFAKIVLIIGIGALIAGGILCAGSISTGKVDVVTIANNGAKKEKNKRYNIEKTEIEAFDEFLIDADAVNVKTIKGNKFAIEYHGYWKPEYKCENGKLTFQLKGTHNVTLDEGIKSFFNVHGDNNKLKIYIPDGAKFKKGEITADAGNVDVSELTVDNFKIDADAGNVKMDSVDVQNCEIDVDAGNIKIEDSVVKNVKMEADAGNIKLLNVVTDVAKMEASMGNIKAEIKGNRDDYDINVDNSLGDVKVDGSKVGSLKEKTGKDKKINIENDMGNVKISFK